MKKTLVGILLSTALSLMPLTSTADEAEAKRQIEAVATGLVASLPTGKKVVLKTVSPEESGLPADFLGKLTSDLEAALLVASEFEIDLTNRQTTEELWAEAIEFNDADFDALHAASGADVALMLSARATEAGVEIALTAYSLNTADAGKVLASSGSTVLALNMQQNLGVDVNSLNDQMAQVLAEIEKVGQTGGLIADPNTYAEHYHNARILQQRGETDLAIKQYELAVANDLQFVDPLIDLVELVRARFGAEGASQYIEKRVAPNLPAELNQMAFVMLQNDITEVAKAISIGEVNFPPALAYWIWEKGQSALASVEGNSVDPRTKIILESALLSAARSNIKNIKDGSVQDYFIDDLRAIRFVQEERAFALEKSLNKAYFTPVSVSVPDSSPVAQRFKPIICSIQYPGYSFGLDVRGGITEQTEVSYEGLDYSPVKRDKLCGEEFDLLPVEPIASEWIGGELNDVYCFLQDGELHSYERRDSSFFLEGVREDQLKNFVYVSNGTFTPYVEHYDFPLNIKRCIEGSDNSSANGSVTKEGNLLKADLLSNLIITDQVSLSHPINVSYEFTYGDISIPAIDIRFDGSFISPIGPAFEFGNAEWGVSYERLNDWFNVPGLIQSSIGQRRIQEIRYTDIDGREKVITNIKEKPLDAIYNVSFGSSVASVNGASQSEIKGAVVELRDRQSPEGTFKMLEVISVEVNSPAHGSGLLPGDKIISLNNSIFWSIDEVNSLISGTGAAAEILNVARNNASGTVDYFMIEVPEEVQVEESFGNIANQSGESEFTRGLNFDVGLMKNTFFQLDQENREMFQIILFDAGLYDNSIDGKWGSQTEAAARGARFLHRYFTGNAPLEGDGVQGTIDSINFIESLYGERNFENLEYMSPSYSQVFQKYCLPENTILTGASPTVDVLVFDGNCSAHSLINGSGSFCLSNGGVDVRLGGATFEFFENSPACQNQSPALYAACTCQ